MATINYFYDTRDYKVYTSEELLFLDTATKRFIKRVPSDGIIQNGHYIKLNSSERDYQRETDKIINMVNKHHDEVKAKELENEKIRLDEEKKREYAERLQRMKEESLKEREEFILEVKETLTSIGRVALKVAIVAGIAVAVYAVFTLARATQTVDIEHGVRVIDSAGTRWFEFGEPSIADYNAGFWNQVEQDLDFIKGLFGR